MTTPRRISELLLILLILGLPFEYYFETRQLTLYTSLKVQLLVFLTGWVGMRLFEFETFSDRKGRERAGWVLSRRLLLALLLFVASQALAAEMAAEFRSNAVRAAGKSALGALVLVAAADLARNADTRGSSHATLGSRLLGALALAGLCTSVIGLGEFAGIGVFGRVINLFQADRYFVGPNLRFCSTMEYPNTAASFLAASLFASLALAGGKEFVRSKAVPSILWASTIIVQGLALVLTYSRGAVAAAVLALALASWLPRRLQLERRMKLMLAACVAILLVGLGALLLRPPASPRKSGPPHDTRVAVYGLAGRGEVKYLLRQREYRERMMVRNDSSLRWVRDNFGIACRWYSLSSKARSALFEAATFRKDVAVGEERELEATFTTPSEEGEYYLVWFIFHRNPAIQELDKSFSPVVLCVIQASAETRPPLLSQDALRQERRTALERRNLIAVLSPTRWELWRAALRMVRSSPLFGVGPDNFRLLKWRYMDIPKGDETVLANSLYLETLAGSGILGLISLLWLLWELWRVLSSRPFRSQSAEERLVAWFGIAYFSAFLIHGTVDYFLKFTPTFLLFWVMSGFLCVRMHEAGDPDANRL